MEIVNLKPKVQTTEKPQEVGNSTLGLINRKELNITGVSKVKSTSDNQIVAIVGGASMTVSGSGLTVKALSIDSGTLDITGLIDGIKFGGVGGAKKPFFKRLFS